MFQDAPRSLPAASNDSEVNLRYTRGEVRIVTEQARYPLTAIPGMVDSSDYELNPEFQRRHRWDVVRKSRLIESFIMNVPIPPIFLYEARYSFYEVMDGLQRLSAIRDFYKDEYDLTGLQEWSDLNGRRYSTLPEEVRRGVDRRYLSSIILLHETAKSDEEAQRLKQLVFERINSGGEQLTAQESRNAIWPGPMNTLCIELSRHYAIRALWHIPAAMANESALPMTDTGSTAGNTLFRTMGDVELVLRFFAYRQQLERQEGRTLREYLDDYLRQANLLPENDISELRTIFTETAQLVHQVLGKRALYMYKAVKDDWRYTRPALTVYDPLMWAFSNYLPNAAALRERTGAARQAFEKTFREYADAFSGRTAEHADIRVRNQLFLEMIETILSMPPDSGLQAEPIEDSNVELELEASFELMIADDLAFSESTTAGDTQNG